MALVELLNKSEEELKVWALSQDASVVLRLFEEVWQQIRDAHLYAGQPRSRQSEEGVSLARLYLKIAGFCGEERMIVDACRMLAYSLTANEQYEEALEYHERSIAGLDSLGDAQQAGRARLGYLAALFHTGRYREALAVAAIAQDSFRKYNDHVGVARLYNNLANLYDRMAEYAKGYEYHLKHSEIVSEMGDREGLAKSYLNLGNSLARLDRFEDADQMYALCERLSHELAIVELEAQAGYNRAYLYYLRGRYSNAFALFGRMRQHFERSGSRRHYALCDLDEAEIYIQLNLPKDAETLARRAAEQFRAIGLKYEEAKATAFLGLALFHRRRFAAALETFHTAQEVFALEGNIYWGALLDVYRAEVHLSLGRYWEAHTLARRGKNLFEEMGFASKTILSLVLLGRIALALDEIDAAEGFAHEISRIAEKTEVPLLLFPCYLLSADIAERKQEWDLAEHFYKLAADDVELHQTRLRHDDLRVTFFKGKHRVYEALVWLSLRKSDQPDSLALAYSGSERAKSRSLIDLLYRHLPAVQAHDDEGQLAVIEKLREELNVLYARSSPELGIVPSQSAIQAIVSKEDELTRSLREASTRDPEYASLQQVSATTLEMVQAMLPHDTTMVEYFIARGEVMAFIITRSNAQVCRRLCTADEVADIQKRLGFHLEEFMLGDDYLRQHSEQIFEATQRHLTRLHRLLFAPIAGLIQTPHITIVPHGCLHVLPFHAFTNGERYIVDDFEISYAPSASVLKYCLDKDDIHDAKPCIVGVSDELAPFVEAEVRSLAARFPDSDVLLNDAATRAAFKEGSLRTSFLHVATHALFRHDNPMFSGFKLSDGWITAQDLFSMPCQTNLVTLSGCKSGMSQVSGADDLLGLTRGFLYAGARSILVSLWNIDDRCTSEFMSRFYEAWRGGSTKSRALTTAMKATREEYRNPFYWSPFQLVGKS